jgi:hypothetical protein
MARTLPLPPPRSVYDDRDAAAHHAHDLPQAIETADAIGLQMAVVDALFDALVGPGASVSTR